ncbi:hypothetical protein [Sphingobacterium sp.]|uniref:DUF7710 domain-containing protein n=1 Tax=Sphingobacterium sp. TaxID=341027 RepID=UPI00258ED2A0|nr:hypothetical protein [Sphingobacterium sp.]WET67845.1 MAG: hypothetical protein P0Y57_18565 [Sphingobacterium sp.]
MLDTIWVFHGEGGRFSSGVFTSIEKAEIWIDKHKLSGVLTAYPIDEGVYDWALFNDFFSVKKQAQMEPGFIQKFTSASQDHYHYENGAKDN